jgi:hypothetical protein
LDFLLTYEEIGISWQKKWLSQILAMIDLDGLFEK